MRIIKTNSRLKNNLSEVSKSAHETSQPIFHTKTGNDDIIILNMEDYENLQFENEVHFKLKAAEKVTEITGKRYSAKDIMKAVKEVIGNRNV